MHNYLSPIDLSTSCFAQSNPGPEKLRSWLYDRSSLTQKLERLYQDLQIQVRQQRTISSASSTLSEHFCNEKEILLREVFLYCHSTPMVFAQTEIPRTTLAGTKLAEIGTASLGKILFQDPNMQRGDIEVAEFQEGSQLYRSLKQNCQHSLWARRSLFYLNSKPLLVSELFLPASGIYRA